MNDQTQKRTPPPPNVTHGDAFKSSVETVTRELTTQIMKCPGGVARTSIGDCHSPDPGSNPGRGAIFSFISKNRERSARRRIFLQFDCNLRREGIATQ